ncbi:hypothetical protein Tco_1086498, partial [Tanacetum coccineum]
MFSESSSSSPSESEEIDSAETEAVLSELALAETSLKLKAKEDMKYKSGLLVLYIDKQIEQSTPSIGKQSTVATSTMERTKQTNLDNDGNNSAPSKKSKDETLLEDSSKIINDTSAGQSEGLDSEFGKTENLSHGKKVRGKRRKGIEQAPTLESSKKKGRLANEPKSLNVDEGAKDDSVKTTTQEIMEEDVTKDMALPVVMGLQLNETTVSQGKIIQKSST